jgi:hypothetical protein
LLKSSTGVSLRLPWEKGQAVESKGRPAAQDGDEQRELMKIHEIEETLISLKASPARTQRGSPGFAAQECPMLWATEAPS